MVLLIRAYFLYNTYTMLIQYLYNTYTMLTQTKFAHIEIHCLHAAKMISIDSAEQHTAYIYNYRGI